MTHKHLAMPWMKFKEVLFVTWMVQNKAAANKCNWIGLQCHYNIHQVSLKYFGQSKQLCFQCCHGDSFRQSYHREFLRFPFPFFFLSFLIFSHLFLFFFSSLRIQVSIHKYENLTVYANSHSTLWSDNVSPSYDVMCFSKRSSANPSQICRGNPVHTNLSWSESYYTFKPFLRRVAERRHPFPHLFFPKKETLAYNTKQDDWHLYCLLKGRTNLDRTKISKKIQRMDCVRVSKAERKKGGRTMNT